MRFLAISLAALLALIGWQVWPPVIGPRPEAMPAPEASARVFAAADVPTLVAVSPAPNWAATQIMAESTSVSLQLTAMWAGATGTAAHIAPTQAEEWRRGTATQQAIERGQSRTATQQAMRDNGTATQESRTQTQFAVDVRRAEQTATMWPAAQRAAAGTAYAQATLAADSLRQERIANDAETWAWVLGVLAIPVSIIIAAWKLASAAADRLAAETRARAQRIASGGSKPHTERAEHESPEVRGAIARNVGDLEMLDSDARRVVDYLNELLERTSPDVTILPGRPAGVGGERQRAVYEWLEARELLTREAGKNCQLAHPLGELVELVASGRV